MMKIFSHRGMGFKKQENSLEAYEEALKRGFSLEIDVQNSQDDVLIVCHDMNLKRLRGTDKKLTEMKFEELSRLDIPSFSDVLDIFKRHSKAGSILAVHVKDENQGDILRLVSEKISESSIDNSCFVFDLTFEGIKKIKSFNEKILVGLSVGEKNYSKTVYTFEEAKHSDNADVIWLDEWHSGLYTDKMLKDIKGLGKPVYAISPELHKIHAHPMGKDISKVMAVWKILINSKVEGICTDYPDELLELIRKNPQ